MQEVSVNHLKESRNFRRILVSSDLPSHGLLKEIPIFSPISQVYFLLSFQISPRSFLSLSPSFPISLWWVLHTPFRLPGVPFLSLSLRRPRFIHPSPQSSLFFPLSPPKSHGSLLSYPPISALSIHSPPKFFIAPFPSSLGLENKISWGPRSYLSPPT